MTTTPAQPEPSERESLAIADALRSEADVSGRPGQWMALNRLAALAHLAARPAPVVSAEAVERAVHDHRYEHFDAYEDPMGKCVLVSDLPQVLAALGITVADTPASDDEGGQGR